MKNKPRTEPNPFGTQKEFILYMLLSKYYVRCYEFRNTKKQIIMFNTRIVELRKEGRNIPNISRRYKGVRHSYYTIYPEIIGDETQDPRILQEITKRNTVGNSTRNDPVLEESGRIYSSSL